MVDALISSGYFRVAGRSDRPSDLVWALDGGHAIVGIHIPAGFARSVSGPDGANVQILVDGKGAKEVKIDKTNLFSFDNKLVLEGEKVTTGEHKIEFRLGARASMTLLEQAGAVVTYCEADVGHKVSADCLRGLETFFS